MRTWFQDRPLLPPAKNRGTFGHDHRGRNDVDPSPDPSFREGDMY
jgi:hypothetical protein